MSSSGYDRLYYTFKDIVEDEYLVEVYREGYATSYQIIYGDGENPVSISYDGCDKNSWDFTHIIGQSLTFKFFVPRADVAVIDDLLESEYKDWIVKLSKNSVTIFIGFLKPENLTRRFEINPPFIDIELSATDGLAELKDIDFIAPNYVDRVTGTMSLLQAIKYALTPVDFEFNFNIQLNTTEVNFINLFENTLYWMSCNAKRFYDITFDEETPTEVKPIKCWDVLEIVLKPFNCRLFQYGGEYWIVNSLEITSPLFVYDWALTRLSTAVTDPRIDISDYSYFPYVEQQKVHPLRSILTTIENEHNGNDFDTDFSDWTNVWQVCLPADLHNDPNGNAYLSYAENAAGNFELSAVDTNQPFITLKSDIAIDFNASGEGHREYLRFSGEYRLIAFEKDNGYLSEVDIKVRMCRDNEWLGYISFGPPNFTEWSGAEAAWKSFDTFNVREAALPLFEITKDGNYSVEFFIDSQRGKNHFDLLTIELRNFKIVQYDSVTGKYFNPSSFNSGPSYYQFNVTANSYEDYEQSLKLFDAVSVYDDAAIFITDPLTVSTEWDAYNQSVSAKIVDIHSRLILKNRSIYKNYLRTTIVDRSFNIDFTKLLVIQSKNYAFCNYSRNFRRCEIEAELIELITGDITSDYDPAEDVSVKMGTVPTAIGEIKSAEITGFVTQTSHGFEVGDVIRCEQPVEYGEITYYKAMADSIAHATAIGIVSEVLDVDRFRYVSYGYLPLEVYEVTAGLYYYLSPVEAGKMVTEPTYEEYEIEQAIGFGTEKGFFVEIDARNLNFKAIVEKSQSPSGIPFYMHIENADISDSDSFEDSSGATDVGDYDRALLIPPDDIQWSYLQTFGSSQGEVLLKAFITDSGTPNTVLIPSGGWFFETYLRTSIQTGMNLKVYVYKRSDVGVETELFNFEQPIKGPSTIYMHDKCYVSEEAIILEATDRLVFKYYAYSDIGPAEDVELLVEGDETKTNVKLPIFDGVFGLFCEDEKVKYNVDDPTAGYLADKIIAGDNITVEEGTGADENKVKISAIIPASGTVVEINSAGDIVINPGESNEETYTPPCNCDPVDMIKGAVTNVKYGYLYNWWAATDARDIAPSGWHVPSKTEFQTLSAYLGGDSVAGGKLKETGGTHWEEPNVGATNEVGFNARGAGSRYYSDGTFINLLGQLKLWASDSGGTSLAYQSYMNHSDDDYYAADTLHYKVEGQSLRWIKDDSTNPGTVTGNDGKVYPTVKIGDQVWTACNIAETKYQNGDLISGPDYTNAEWAALATEAYCIYDDDEDNALEDTAAIEHNSTTGKQGGDEALNEFYHHTSDEHTTHVYEAPEDNGIYARFNGEWVKIGEISDSASSGEYGQVEDQVFDYHDIEAGTSQTYKLDPKASYDYMILSLYIESDDSMDNIALKINSTAVGGLSAVDISNSADVEATSDNIVAIGDVVTLVTSGTDGDPTYITGKYRYIRI